ncbi:DUF4007 family protein (plasmid) [Picosynechococcus sp. PCC 11901]|uniref:DUF4007 family protein n=1 Tax=Picosynechococcus sp. PCC 11901 TaxID=2579791 RepID=UPI0010FC2CA5|nr:DUF4007 family protein [Picosynechococcus sp. PCC 11901]QCS48112.1 DUF4007 family protein [Picosynechococcus sp. PCC 11901]
MALQISLGIVQQPQKLIFARHETFHPRFGWLKKGFDRAKQNSHIFLDEDAPVQLGVGKNMVRSIRYWCSAFKLLEDDQPTTFGEKLLGDRGWDTYLEDPASLWLLHWKLLEAPCEATTWYFVFNVLNRAEFTDRELLEELEDFGDRLSSKTALSSLKKDASCLLRMYAKQSSHKISVAEDSLDCPFVELGLIYPTGDNRHYTFRVGYKPSLVPEIILYAALHFAYQVNESARTIPLGSLLYDQGSPGKVFKLTESALCAAIEILAKKYDMLKLEDAAGKLQLSFNTDEPLVLAENILENYYTAQ